MTLQQKLKYLEENYPEAYKIFKSLTPDLISNPETPSLNDVEQFNFLIDGILDEDEVHFLHHYIS